MIIIKCWSIAFFSMIAFACTSHPDTLNRAANQTKKDTIFLQRDLSTGIKTLYHAVYIDTNRNSIFYKELADFSFDKYENMDEYNKQLKEKGIHLHKVTTPGLPVEWVPLYLYKNKYYVYSPSDKGELNRRILNDSLLIFWSIEGPIPYVLLSVKKVNEQTYTVHTKDVFVQAGDFFRPEIVNIYMIDPEKKIAVWEYKSLNQKEYTYELYIARESIQKFDMIVNYCKTDKMSEFNFDTPDFTKLLEKISISHRKN